MQCTEKSVERILRKQKILVKKKKQWKVALLNAILLSTEFILIWYFSGSAAADARMVNNAKR